MTRKFWMLIALAAVLGGVSLYLNQDWFAKDNIQITHRSRPGRNTMFGRRRTDDSLVDPIFFAFDRKLQLTSLRVVPMSDIRTNKYPHAIWDLVSESNSAPIKSFAYAMPIKGMHPAVKGAGADPLEPGVPYRLYVEAGPFKAEHDFTPVQKSP